MKNCECYSFKLINKTNDPILKNVDFAIVLTMENSSRKFEDKVLLNLAPLTYVQINKGYKICNKPGVTTPAADILHAHKNVYKNTINYNNIIIFEDDAVFNSVYSIDEFKKIDDFIGRQKFDIYSLGSISLNIPSLSDHKLIISSVGTSHAIIYSKQGRSSSLYINGNHVDTDIISSLQYKYKYKYPLVCQTFPDTLSIKEWGSMPENFIFMIYRNITNAHKNIEPFWSSMYIICDWGIYIIILILFIIIIKYYK